LRCGEIFSDSTVTHFLLILTVKKVWKSVNIWWSRGAYNKRANFWGATLYACVSGACEGTLACSTCHLIFSQQNFNELPQKPTDEELDMLDLAYGLADT